MLRDVNTAAEKAPQEHLAGTAGDPGRARRHSRPVPCARREAFLELSRAARAGVAAARRDVYLNRLAGGALPREERKNTRSL